MVLLIKMIMLQTINKAPMDDILRIPGLLVRVVANGILPISTGFAKIYEIIKYHNGILIRYPNKKDITKLPVFEENKKLLETLNLKDEGYIDLYKNAGYDIKIEAKKLQDFYLSKIRKG